MATRPHLFVYGSLRPELGHPISRFLIRHARRVGDGDISAELYNVGHYPAAVRTDDEAQRVRGTVYALLNPKRVLAVLDPYEGAGPDDPPPYLFIREEAAVRLDGGARLMAWVYFYNHDATGLPRIHSGDYLRFTSNMRRRA